MDLFFVMSGFLIGMLLLHARQKGRQGIMGLGRFYLRRGFRTFPLYYLTLGLLAMSVPLTTGQRANLIKDAFYLSNWGHYAIKHQVMSWGWSLCIEEQFYLTVPLFFIGLFAIKAHWIRIGILVVLCLSALAMRLLIYYSHVGPWLPAEMLRDLYIRSYTRYDVLVAGILVAYVQFYFADWMREKLRVVAIRRILWTIVVCCLLVLLVPRRLIADDDMFKIFTWGTVTSVMYVPLILLLVNSNGPVQIFLSKPLFLKFATLGYEIYLLHVPFAAMVSRFFVHGTKSGRLTPGLAWLMSFILVVTLSTGGSYLLHLVVEKPMLGVRNRLVP